MIWPSQLWNEGLSHVPYSCLWVNKPLEVIITEIVSFLTRIRFGDRSQLNRGKGLQRDCDNEVGMLSTGSFFETCSGSSGNNTKLENILITGCEQKNEPPPWQIYPIFDQFSKQFLKFLTKQVKSKLFCVRWKYRVTVKMIKNAVKVV